MLREQFGTTAGVDVSLLRRVLTWAVWPTTTAFVAPGAFPASLGKGIPAAAETREPAPDLNPEAPEEVARGPKWQRPTPRWFTLLAFIWVNLNFFA